MRGTPDGLRSLGGGGVHPIPHPASAKHPLHPSGRPPTIPPTGRHLPSLPRGPPHPSPGCPPIPHLACGRPPRLLHPAPGCTPDIESCPQMPPCTPPCPRVPPTPHSALEGPLIPPPASHPAPLPAGLTPPTLQAPAAPDTALRWGLRSRCSPAPAPPSPPLPLLIPRAPPPAPPPAPAARRKDTRSGPGRWPWTRRRRPRGSCASGRPLPTFPAWSPRGAPGTGSPGGRVGAGARLAQPGVRGAGWGPGVVGCGWLWGASGCGAGVPRCARAPAPGTLEASSPRGPWAGPRGARARETLFGAYRLFLFMGCRIDPYGFERPEDFDYAAYEEFFSTYLVILTRRAIKWSKLLKGSGRVQRSGTGEWETWTAGPARGEAPGSLSPHLAAQSFQLARTCSGEAQETLPSLRDGDPGLPPKQGLRSGVRGMAGKKTAFLLLRRRVKEGSPWAYTCSAALPTCFPQGPGLLPPPCFPGAPGLEHLACTCLSRAFSPPPGFNWNAASRRPSQAPVWDGRSFLLHHTPTQSYPLSCFCCPLSV